ncbi:MAG: hypothetical protein NTV54_11890, partial [Ignavibacteriales bacterium]|nr:hypothetical protein [Ignavibacteriales bacterium]
IRSFGATMSYYESRGELWERQMLIKVRCAAGSKALGTRLLDRLRPFVYPRSLFANPLTEIARIKSRIEAQSGDEFNIKLCPGGIRDIEFVVQALQLMNGGRSPELQIGTTLDAIDRLARMGMLSSPEAATLRDAYRFYRQVEHRLQMLDYAQTHSLPIAPSERTKLALRMEMRLSSFDRALKVSMASVRQIFDAVFAVDIAAVPSDVERLLLENIDSVFVQQFCSLYRLRDRVAAVKRLRRMLHGSGLPGMKEFTEQTRSAFRTIAPQLLAHIGSTDDPDETLARCEQVFSSFPAVDSLYRALANPSLSSAVTVLCGKSRWITRRLANNRALVDYLITRLPDIAAGADNPFPDTVDACSLAEWKLQTESTAGMRYLLGITDERQFFASVSRTAERIVEAIFQSESRRLKLPASTSFCILALGKLGGNELLPGSDLDLIFIFHATKKTDAGRCEKLAASIIERASAITPEGSLYDVDARLRPEGRNAPLAVSLQSYEEYLKKRASLWERQSLTRARVVAGNTSLADDLQSLIHGAVFGTPLPADWRAQILSMRKKTEARSRTRTSYFFDAKLSAGGLMDIEFSVQALQLAAGLSAPDSANTYELLDFHAAQTGILQPMIRNYAVLRRLETALRLALDISSSVVPTDRGAQNTIARWLGCSGLEELGQQVKTIAKQNRAILESILTTHT